MDSVDCVEVTLGSLDELEHPANRTARTRSAALLNIGEFYRALSSTLRCAGVVGSLATLVYRCPKSGVGEQLNLQCIEAVKHEGLAPGALR